MINPCAGLSGLFAIESELVLEADLSLKSYWVSLVGFFLRGEKGSVFGSCFKTCQKEFFSGRL